MMLYRMFVRIAILSLLIKCQDFIAEATGKLIGDLRIVGGTDADPYPTLAFSAGSKLCGGTLIYPDILLSAAHCAGAFVEKGVYLGGDSVDGVVSLFFEVEKEFPHPGYDNSTVSNDIMLVKLTKSSDVTPQELNFDPLFPLAGIDATVLGYGATSEGGTSSYILQKALIPIVPYDQCDSFWNKLEDVTQICTGVPDGSKDTCQGDSGGPLLVNDIQVGIVSFGQGCARPDTPSVYSRVSGYQQFIASGICDLSSLPPATCPVSTPMNAPVAAPTKTPVKTSTIVPTRPPMEVLIAPTENPVASPSTVTPAISPITDFTIAPTQRPFLPPSASPVAVTTVAPVKPSTTVHTLSPTQLPVDTPIDAPLSTPTENPVASPSATLTTMPASSPTVSTIAPGATPTELPISPPNLSPMATSTVAPMVSPIPSPILLPTEIPIATTINVPITTSLPVNNPSTPVDASSRSFFPVLVQTTAPVRAPGGSPVVPPLVSPATTPRMTPVAAPSPAVPTNSTAQPPVIGPIPTPVSVPSPVVNIPSPGARPISVQSAPIISLAPSITKMKNKEMGAMMKKVTTMKMGMGGGFNKSPSFPPGLAPSEISTGVKKHNLGMEMMMKGSRSTTDDDMEIGVFLKVNTTLSTGGMNSKVKGKQNSESTINGAMMIMDSGSSIQPKAMRMSRLGKNSTKSSKLMQTILHALHHSNISVHHYDNNTMSVNVPEKNSTIGNLLQRLKNDINQGLHYDSNHTSSNNTLPPDKVQEGKFRRLTFLWNKLVGGFGFGNDMNTTTAVGTRIKEWFIGGN